MWPHESVPTPLNYRQLWGAEHLPTSTQRHYSIFCSMKQKIQRRQNNKIWKDEADIEIKIQRGWRKRIKSAPPFSLILFSELVMHIVNDNYSWLSQYLSKSWSPGPVQGYLGNASCFWLTDHFSLQPFHLCVWGSTKRPPSIRVLGTYTPARWDCFRECSQFAWNKGWIWLLVPPTPLPTTPVSSNRVDSWSRSLARTSLLL